VRKQAAGAVIVIISPNPSSRWRVASGAIERSEDGGATWLPLVPVGAEAVRAGTSPSPLACWLVGQGGLVMLASDGTNFTRLRFPEQVDLVSVQSTSVATATVTAADGRTFVTANAGRTWNLR
jgi:photosystem II stability/assembly factor-like uncharacterized protein